MFVEPLIFTIKHIGIQWFEETNNNNKANTKHALIKLNAYIYIIYIYMSSRSTERDTAAQQ